MKSGNLCPGFCCAPSRLRLMRRKSAEFIMAPGAVAPDQGRISACTLGLFFSSLALPSYKRAGSISALLDLLNDETLKITLFAPAGEHLVKRHRAFGVLALE